MNILDLVLGRGKRNIKVSNANSFFPGMKLDVIRALGEPPIARLTVKKEFPRSRVVLVEETISSRVRRGDLLIYIGSPE